MSQLGEEEGLLACGGQRGCDAVEHFAMTGAFPQQRILWSQMAATDKPVSSHISLSIVDVGGKFGLSRNVFLTLLFKGELASCPAHMISGQFPDY